MKKASTDEEILERVVAHFTGRIRQGKHPSIAKYKKQFPHLSDEIDELLTSVAMIEGLKQDASPANTMETRLSEAVKIERLGDYRIIREIGRGGMGIVFEAVHESLGRRVALKVLPPRSLDNDKRIERFRREAQAAAKLHHTNIVGVFGVGQDGDYHYFVMEFVDGCGLNDVIADYRSNSSNVLSRTPNGSQTVIGPPGTLAESKSTLDVAAQETEFSVSTSVNADPSTKITPPENDRYRWTARIGAQIADALATAHHQRILHRDIKPANLLLDQSGAVWIADFGLAKNLTNQSMTKTGDILGTPRYMAPESLEGTYDARSEVYCLGLTLYEMATLRPAFTETTTPELLRQITTARPPSPRKIAPEIPNDLNIIIEKAIAKEPNERYQNAIQFRNDLRAFLDDRSISAKRSNIFEQAWRWRRRNPLVASLAVASILLLGVVAATASTGYLYTTAAYGLLSEQNEDLEQAMRDKQIQLEKTDAQFKRAESNVSITLEMFDEMFNQILSKGETNDVRVEAASLEGFEELSNLNSKITGEDAAFLERMLVFYEKFAAENADNKDLLRESAASFRRVANFYQVSNDQSKAPAVYEKALKVYQDVLAQVTDSTSPEFVELTLATVRTRNELGVYYKNLSVKSFREDRLFGPRGSRTGRPIGPMWDRDMQRGRQEFRRRTNATTDTDRDPELSERERAHIRKNVQHAEKARNLFTDSRSQLEALNDREQDDVKFELAKTLYHLASSSMRIDATPPVLGKSPDVKADKKDYTYNGKIQIRDSQDSLNQLISKHPDEPRYRLFLANANTQIAIFTMQTTGLSNELETCLVDLEELVKVYPEVHEFCFLLAQVHANRSLTTGENLDSLNKAREYCYELVQNYPWISKYEEFLKHILMSIRQYHQQRVENTQEPVDPPTAEDVAELDNHKNQISEIDKDVADLNRTKREFDPNSNRLLHYLRTARNSYTGRRYTQAKKAIETAIRLVKNKPIPHLERLISGNLKGVIGQRIRQRLAANLNEKDFALVHLYIALEEIHRKLDSPKNAAEARRKYLQLMGEKSDEPRRDARRRDALNQMDRRRLEQMRANQNAANQNRANKSRVNRAGANKRTNAGAAGRGKSPDR